MNVIETRDLSKRFNRRPALERLNVTIEENKITGLIGRNGAGKSTLLSLIAGYLRKSEGELRVFGLDPFNQLTVAANMIFIDEHMVFPNKLSLSELLEAVPRFYPQWNSELASKLMSYFELNPKLCVPQLSKGMRSTFYMIIGLASRAPLTILDEPTTGMDAAVRKDIYKAILRDYMAFPRTILLSSHLLNELDELLEDVLLIHHGQKVLHQPIDELKELALGLQGDAAQILKLTEGMSVLYSESFGKNSLYTVIKNDFTEQALQQLRMAGIELSSVKVADLCVYLTRTRGIEHVFTRS